MRCRTARRLLSRRVDGMLHGGEAEALGSHLSSCADCSADAGRLEQAWRALGELEDPRDAPDDWARVQAMAESAGGDGMTLGFLRRLSPAPISGLVVAGMASLGIVLGIVVAREALAPNRDGFEATVLSSALGDLPWGSPAAGLDLASHGARSAHEETP